MVAFMSVDHTGALTRIGEHYGVNASTILPAFRRAGFQMRAAGH
jgi:hypothetical protein